MKAIELQGEVDDQHRLLTDAPQSLLRGSVRIIVLISEENEGCPVGASGVSSEWAAELNDPGQDIYTSTTGSQSMRPEGTAGRPFSEESACRCSSLEAASVFLRYMQLSRP
jgi:hypothetical protein